jgi:archaellum component FlaC
MIKKQDTEVKTEEPATTNPNEPTLTQIWKTLISFTDETRGNFSTITEDRNHDYEQLQLANRNIVALEGKVENLSMQINKMQDAHKRDSQMVTDKVESSVSDLQDTVAPKKFIIKEIPYFSVRLWFKNLLRR